MGGPLLLEVIRRCQHKGAGPAGGQVSAACGSSPPSVFPAGRLVRLRPRVPVRVRHESGSRENPVRRTRVVCLSERRRPGCSEAAAAPSWAPTPLPSRASSWKGACPGSAVPVVPFQTLGGRCVD